MHSLLPSGQAIDNKSSNHSICINISLLQYKRRLPRCSAMKSLLVIVFHQNSALILSTKFLADLPCCTLRRDNPKASIRLSQTGTSTLPPRANKSPRTNRKKKRNTPCHPEPSHQPSNPISNSHPRHLSSSSLPRSDVASTGSQLASSAARSHPTTTTNNKNHHHHLSQFFSSAGFEIWLFGKLNSEGQV